MLFLMHNMYFVKFNLKNSIDANQCNALSVYLSGLVMIKCSVSSRMRSMSRYSFSLKIIFVLDDSVLSVFSEDQFAGNCSPFNIIDL